MATIRRGEKAPLGVLQAVAVLGLAAVVLAAQAAPAAAFEYVNTDMETAVRGAVEKAIRDDNGVGAALVRLLFHDCWVKGCDGSVLLGERTAEESKSATGVEKNARSNIGLGGFNVVDDIKASARFAGVSCADIVVFAAREATKILSRGKIVYAVTGGRKDGLISSAREADAVLPGSTFTFDQLRGNFLAQGFTQEELVVLSGAHAVGVAHYDSFEDRLKPSSSPIDGRYQEELNRRRGGSGGLLDRLFGRQPKVTELNNIRDMDGTSQSLAGYDATGVDTAAKGVLDNSYYHANLQNRVLFTSDWELRNDTSRRAEADMVEYRDDAGAWFRDFAAAMAKLSNLAGKGGEIRRNCGSTN